MKTALYNLSAKQVGTADLSDGVFARPWNETLVQQVILAYQANARAGTAHTKDRSEVAGGGKKPWRQKGTGRARHGSRRSPIWVHGGISHGPRTERDWSQKINDKMKLAALATVLSAKLQDAEVLSLESVDFTKTKDASDALVKLQSVEGFETLYTKTNPNNVLVVVTDQVTDSTVRALRNIPCVTVLQASRVNALSIANARYVLLLGATEVNQVLTTRVARLSKKAVTAQ
jgi:large subunit ribosomal protein L4